MPEFFITGTNTDVGKTVFTASFLKYLLDSGLDAVAAKPVQTGVNHDSDGKMLAPDMEVYRQACGFKPLKHDMPLAFQFGYKHACSPHLAAYLEGGEIAAESISAKLKILASRHRITVAEGAGGLLVPLNQKQTMLNVVTALNWPVIIVAANALGVINHVLLTVECLRSHGVKIAGIVINQLGPDDEESRYIIEDNVQAIEFYSQVPVLARLPYIKDFDCDSATHWEELTRIISASGLARITGSNF